MQSGATALTLPHAPLRHLLRSQRLRSHHQRPQIAYIVTVESNSYQVHFINGCSLSLSTQRGISLLEYLKSLTLEPKAELSKDQFRLRTLVIRGFEFRPAPPFTFFLFRLRALT